MAHYDFTTPVTEEQVRKLRVNDTVTLNGTLYGIRDATYIHLFDRGRKTRFDLRGHALIHTAPNVRKVEKSQEHPAGYAPICLGTTTSDPAASVPAKLGVKWTHVDSNQTVNEETRDVNLTGTGNTEFHIAKPDGWPTGKYKVEVSLDGNVVQTREFEVK